MATNCGMSPCLLGIWTKCRERLSKPSDISANRPGRCGETVDHAGALSWRRKHLWRVVRVPSREDEDTRHIHRELEALKRERTRHRNRIHGILIQQGLQVRNPSPKKFVQELELIRTWDGRKLPAEMKVRQVRVYERLRLLEDQISTLVKENIKRLQGENARMAQVAQLLRFPGIGPVSSYTFVTSLSAGAVFRTVGKWPPWQA
jgi:transposase